MQVDFHSGMADKLGYACRLLRKAVARGSRVQVRGEAAQLDALDQSLWVFDPHEFVPHLRWSAADAPPLAMRRTPVWLLAHGAPWPAAVEPPEVVLNLGPEALRPGDGVQQAARVIELVGTGEAEVAAGRQRWRQYLESGRQPAHHAVGGEGA